MVATDPESRAFERGATHAIEQYKKAVRDNLSTSKASQKATAVARAFFRSADDKTEAVCGYLRRAMSKVATKLRYIVIGQDLYADALLPEPLTATKGLAGFEHRPLDAADSAPGRGLKVRLLQGDTKGYSVWAPQSGRTLGAAVATHCCKTGWRDDAAVWCAKALQSSQELVAHGTLVPDVGINTGRVARGSGGESLLSEAEKRKERRCFATLLEELLRLYCTHSGSTARCEAITVLALGYKAKEAAVRAMSELPARPHIEMIYEYHPVYGAMHPTSAYAQMRARGAHALWGALGGSEGLVREDAEKHAPPSAVVTPAAAVKCQLLARPPVRRPSARLSCATAASCSAVQATPSSSKRSGRVTAPAHTSRSAAAAEE